MNDSAIYGETFARKPHQSKAQARLSGSLNVTTGHEEDPPTTQQDPTCTKTSGPENLTPGGTHHEADARAQSSPEHPRAKTDPATLPGKANLRLTRKQVPSAGLPKPNHETHHCPRLPETGERSTC